MDLALVLAEHKKWFNGEDGARADLRGADLRCVDLRDADLRGADLRGADFRRADLRGANFRQARLEGARLNWSSHNLLSEILRRAAGDDIEKRKVAGLIAISTDLCWGDFLALKDPLTGWALDTLRPWADENAPEVLKSK